MPFAPGAAARRPFRRPTQSQGPASRGPSRRGPAPFPAFLLLVAGLLCPGPGDARAATDPGKAGSGPASSVHTVAVLDPVDLGYQSGRPAAAGYLRKGLGRSGHWAILPGDTTARRLREANVDPGRPCKEFQCAFDAGSALQVEYVLFGTLASLKELQAYTLVLLHVPTSQVVWSRAGDIPRRDGQRPAAALESALGWAVETLDPSELDMRKTPSLGLMAVVDAGDGSTHARAVRERAMAHVFASRNYDLIAQEEFEDLLRALDIPMPVEGTPEHEILGIGRRMDVRYVLLSRLTHARGSYRLNLVLRDLDKDQDVRRWPSRDVADFARLLRLEDRFFTTLSDPDLPAGPAIPPPSTARKVGKYASVAVALATGVGLGWMAWDSKQGADSEYQRFQAARSQTEADAARRRVEEEDVQTRRYGILSGICLLLGVAVWTF